MKMMLRIPCDWEGYSKAGRQTQKKMTERKWPRQNGPTQDRLSVLSAGIRVRVRMKIFMRRYYGFFFNNSPAEISLLPGTMDTKGWPF
jgi:hypothetical protein